ncbi:hypothetical protein QOT17_019121 [Balamuthia mandrillaris]
MEQPAPEGAQFGGYLPSTVQESVPSTESNEPEQAQLSRKGDTFYGWHHCYGEDASSLLTTYTVEARLVATLHGEPGIEIEVWGNANSPIDEALYKFTIWEERTGQRIKYKGEGTLSPYNVCCNFLDNSNCTVDRFLENEDEHYEQSAGGTGVGWLVHDCPIQGSFRGRASRPLFRTEAGKYEVELSIVAARNGAPLKEEQSELLCVVVPFHFKGHVAGSPEWRLGDAAAHAEEDVDVEEDKEVTLDRLVAAMQHQRLRDVVDSISLKDEEEKGKEEGAAAL